MRFPGLDRLCRNVNDTCLHLRPLRQNLPREFLVFFAHPLGNITKICYNTFNAPESVTDANGIVTKYAYNDAGLVTHMERLDGSETLTTCTFTYHADGQLASATVGSALRADRGATPLSETETFLWDGLALIQRGDEQFVNEPHVGGGNPVASSKGTSYFNDALGTTVGSKSNGKYSAAALTAFGESLETLQGEVTSNFKHQTSNSQNFFTGKPYVEGLGHAFLMRNYRAGLAKWQSADPMGYPDGWNQMKYGVNNPSSGVDLFGCVWWNPFSWFDGPEEQNPYDFYVDEDISIPIDVEPKAFKVYCGAKPTTIKVTVGNSGSFSFKVDLTKIADIILQELGIEISGLSSPTYTFEIKRGEYTISLPGYQCDSKHHDGTGYMDGVIIAHPVYMREYKLNGEGKKEYLSNQLKYGLLYSFLPVNKTRCE